jgi:hypothetical protein
MNYILVTLLFVGYVLFSWLIKKMLKEEIIKKNKVKEQLNPIVIEEEEKYNIKESRLPFLNMRMMSIFMAVENEQEKENLRNRMITILEDAKLRPAYFLLMNLTKPVFFVFMIYLTYLFFLEEPQPILSYITIAVMTFSLLKDKKIMFAILFLIIGIWFYPKIPGTMMLLILMNRLWSIYQNKNK